MSVSWSLSTLDSAAVWMLISSIWKSSTDFHFLLGFQIKLFFVMSNSALLANTNDRDRKLYEMSQFLELHHCEEIFFSTTQQFCFPSQLLKWGQHLFPLPQRTSERAKSFSPYDISGIEAIKVTSIVVWTLGESHDRGQLCSLLSGAGKLCSACLLRAGSSDGHSLCKPYHVNIVPVSVLIINSYDKYSAQVEIILCLCVIC